MASRLTAALLVMCAPAATAQNGGAAALSSSFRLDLAVPEAPALLLADVDADGMLRPGSIHDLALSFRGFSGEGGAFRLPQSFGVEVAPLFLRRSFSREDYKRNLPLSRLRLSLASRRGSDDGSATVLSFGGRTSLINRADLRDNDEYRKRILPLLDTIGALTDAERFIGYMVCPDNDPLCVSRAGPVDGVSARYLKRCELGLRLERTSAAPGESYEAYRERVLPIRDSIAVLNDLLGVNEPALYVPDAAGKCVRRLPNVSQRRRELVARIEAIRDRVVKENWNAEVLDVAYAGRLTAKDSLGHDPSVNAHVAWASWALPVSRWGQIVFGARAGYEENDTTGDWDSSIRGGGRLYAGSNAFKGFVEAGAGSVDDGRWTAGGGAEVKLFNGVYAALSTGYEYGVDGGGRLKARINLRTAPENVLPARVDAVAPAAGSAPAAPPPAPLARP